MRRLAKRLINDENGATAIEYSLIAAFIAIAIITVLQAVGIELSSIFVDVEAGLKKRPAA
ncbi:MAG: Flp family type IVb pilin [Hyphomicrobiaceae bacterium]